MNEIYKKELEIQIVKNYNNFLKNGLEDKDTLKYYLDLGTDFSTNRYTKLGEILNEIYEYQNDNSYILK